MRKRRLILVAAVVGVLGLISWAMATRPPAVPDPVYEGYPVSFWITRKGLTVVGPFIKPEMDTKAVPYLVQALKTHRNGALRWAYYRLSLRFPDWLQQRLPSSDTYLRISIRRHAILYLGQLGTAARPAIPELSRVLKEDDVYSVRMYAAGALVNIANRDDESVVEALVAAATKDKDAYVRKYAGDALAQLNPEAAAQAGVTNSPAGK